MTAKLALEWIDGDQTQATFHQTGTQDTPNKIAAAVGTF